MVRARGAAAAGKKGALRLSPRILRMRFRDGESLSHFAFLVFSDNRNKKNTFIGVSNDPVSTVFNMNRIKPTGKRGGKTKHYTWFLEQIIGPFDSLEDGNRFRDHWARNSRALYGRAKKGRELAERHELACWDMHVTRLY